MINAVVGSAFVAENAGISPLRREDLSVPQWEVVDAPSVKMTVVAGVD